MAEQWHGMVETSRTGVATKFAESLVIQNGQKLMTPENVTVDFVATPTPQKGLEVFLAGLPESCK